MLGRIGTPAGGVLGRTMCRSPNHSWSPHRPGWVSVGDRLHRRQQSRNRHHRPPHPSLPDPSPHHQHGGGADAGMLPAANLEAIHETELRFMVGFRITKAPHNLGKHFHWSGNDFDDGQSVDTIGNRGNPDPDRLKTRPESVWNPDQHSEAGTPRRQSRAQRNHLAQKLRANHPLIKTTRVHTPFIK